MIPLPVENIRDFRLDARVGTVISQVAPVARVVPLPHASQAEATPRLSTTGREILAAIVAAANSRTRRRMSTSWRDTTERCAARGFAASPRGPVAAYPDRWTRRFHSWARNPVCVSGIQAHRTQNVLPERRNRG